MPKVGDGIQAEVGGWNFDGEVPQNFDEHVAKSVPLYFEGHEVICNLSDFFVKTNSSVYELGCATGTLLIRLAEHHRHKKNTKFIGVDIEPKMIAQAQQKAQQLSSPHQSVDLEFINDDILHLEMEPADLIVCYYTIQFIRPSLRQNVIDKIYERLQWGGALLLFEKVRGADARFQDILTTLYQEYKLKQGYSAEDILSKNRSLKGVLEPFSTQGNLDLLHRAGFRDVNSIQKYLCFEGFLAIK